MARTMGLLAVAGVCLVPLAAFGADEKADWAKETYTNAKKEQLPYRLFEPVKGDPKTRPKPTQRQPEQRHMDAPSAHDQIQKRLDGFHAGARIWVRARGIGTGGIGEWCDPATSIVP